MTPPATPPQNASDSTMLCHFMGKKSTGDFPYIYDERNESPFSSLSDNIKQLGDYLQWEETFKQFLKLLDGNENRSSQVLRDELPFSAKNAWEAEDNSSLKDVTGANSGPQVQQLSTITCCATGGSSMGRSALSSPCPTFREWRIRQKKKVN
uniref:Gastrin-releasing peptide n=1 Tax=Anolis carolinensis TaxID=28377 RepID=A0A803T0N9_ANOCA